MCGPMAPPFVFDFLANFSLKPIKIALQFIHFSAWKGSFCFFCLLDVLNICYMNNIFSGLWLRMVLYGIWHWRISWSFRRLLLLWSLGHLQTLDYSELLRRSRKENFITIVQFEEKIISIREISCEAARPRYFKFQSKICSYIFNDQWLYNV